MEQTKTCRKCGRTLPLSRFHRLDRTGRRRPDCADCRNLAHALYRAQRQVLVILARDYGHEDALRCLGLLKGRLDGR